MLKPPDCSTPRLVVDNWPGRVIVPPTATPVGMNWTAIIILIVVLGFIFGWFKR